MKDLNVKLAVEKIVEFIVSLRVNIAVSLVRFIISLKVNIPVYLVR
jgi:hypothetical protein